MRDHPGGPNRPTTGPAAAVIDLGAIGPLPEPYAGARRTLPWWWRRWRRPAAAVTALVLAGLAASAPDPAPTSPLVLVADLGSGVAHLVIAGDLLLVEQTTRGEPPVWSAHRLPAGDYLWSTADQLSFSDGRSQGDGPILTSNANGSQATVARDRDTGAVVWSARTPFVTPAPDAGVVVRTDPIRWIPTEGEGEWESEGEFSRFEWYDRVVVADRDTGVARWSERSEDGWRVAVGEVAVVLLDRDGTLDVRELETGRTRASFTLPEAEPDSLSVVGDTVVAASTESASPVVRGHPLDAPTRPWEATVEVGDPGGMLATREFVQVWDGSETSLVDFRDGRTYTVPGDRTERARLLDSVIFFIDSAYRIREVVNRTTGDVIADLTGWQLVEPGTDSPDHLLLSSSPPTGGTILGRLDLATGEMSYLGHVPAWLSGCHSFDRGLVCSGQGGLSLWRWR